MRFEGGCYCRKVRYVAEGDPVLKAQCHCRECQYISGGAPAPKTFTRTDLDRPVTREFCENCGAHLTTRSPNVPLVILKVGTLDDPSLFGVPQMAINTLDKQPFHMIPEGLPTFERLPPR
jgi:hypothetical protein